MGDRPVHGSVLEDAQRAFEARIAELGGEQACIMSLPMLADEVAAETAAGDAELEAQIRARLRARAGLNAEY